MISSCLVTVEGARFAPLARTGDGMGRPSGGRSAAQVWLARVRAGIAAGISVANWKSAVLRAWPGRIPRLFNLLVSRAVLIGRPGWPPGNSQGEGARAPMVACPLRFAVTERARAATGS